MMFYFFIFLFLVVGALLLIILLLVVFSLFIFVILLQVVLLLAAHFASTCLSTSNFNNTFQPSNKISIAFWSSIFTFACKLDIFLLSSESSK